MGLRSRSAAPAPGRLAQRRVFRGFLGSSAAWPQLGASGIKRSFGISPGLAAFPAILIALTLQAAFFSIGGPTTLGLNTVIMALPAVVCHYLFRRAAAVDSEWMVFGVGFAAGATAMILGASDYHGRFDLAGKEFSALAPLILAVHLPSAVLEGMITGSIVVFIRKVRPELLDAPRLAPAYEPEHKILRDER